jgi:zinc/manganese transport system substrate-binding protein
MAVCAALVVPAKAHADLEIVATLPSLAAIAAEVGGQSVTVRSLTSPAEDPHFVDARPDFIVALSRADVLIVNGLDLEIGWLPSLQAQSRNPDISTGGSGFVDASAGLALLEVATGAVDRSMGDVHPGGNPHYLLDPRRAADVALAIGARLAQLDPTNAATYLANSATVSAELTGFADQVAAEFADLGANRPVVTYHRSFVYLAEWLGLTVAIELEPRPGVAPDPGHVATVLSTMRSASVHVILQEAWYPSSTSRQLAELAGATLITVDGGPDFAGGESYTDWLRTVTEAIHASLRG